MPSESSSPDDLCACGHARKDHHAVARSCEVSACFCSDPTYPAEPVCTCQTGTWDKFDSPEDCEIHGAGPEPLGSTSSSTDEVLCRRCGHRRDWHSRPGFCAGDVPTPAGDDRNNCPCKIFWPAHLSMAGPIDLRSAPADAETAGEPEAPECSHDSREVMGEHHTPEGWVKSRTCADCRERLDNIIEAEPHRDIQSAPPRRPPYAVAYAVEGGAQYEIALPGDATVGAFNGALVITHQTSPITGLVQIRPMEGA